MKNTGLPRHGTQRKQHKEKKKKKKNMSFQEDRLKVGECAVYKDQDVCSVLKVHYGAKGVDFYTVVIDSNDHAPERVGRELQVAHASLLSGKLRRAVAGSDNVNHAPYAQDNFEADEKIEACENFQDEATFDSASCESAEEKEEKEKEEEEVKEDGEDSDQEGGDQDTGKGEERQEEEEEGLHLPTSVFNIFGARKGAEERQRAAVSEEEAEREWQKAVALERCKSAYRRALIEQRLQEQQKRERLDAWRAAKTQQRQEALLRNRRPRCYYPSVDPLSFGMRRNVFRDPFDNGFFLVHG